MTFFEIGRDPQGAVFLVAATGQNFIYNLL